MKRRDVLKAIPATAAAPVLLAAGAGPAAAQSSGASGTSSSGGGAAVSKGRNAPAWAEHLITSDMNGLGPDGAPSGKTATFTGASKAGASAGDAPAKMQLTDDEQAILDGRDGEEKAKLMKILVKFGETFGATKLLDLGGAPHSNLYIGRSISARSSRCWSSARPRG